MNPSTIGDDQVFRDAMSVFPTGVVAVTSIADGAPMGFTVGSFFSVSLKPRLVGFCANRQSGTWARIRATGRFCVNILAEDQRFVSERLSVPGADDKLSAVEWDGTGYGLPVIKGVLAWFACDIADTYPAGTHTVVIGAVTGLAVTRQDCPLVFHRREYCSVNATGP